MKRLLILWFFLTTVICVVHAQEEKELYKQLSESRKIEIDRLKEDLISLQKQYDNLEKDIETLDQQIVDTVSYKNEQLETLKSKNDQTAQELQKAQELVDQNSKARWIAKNEALKKEKEKLEVKIENLEKLMEQKEATIAELKGIRKNFNEQTDLIESLKKNTTRLKKTQREESQKWELAKQGLDQKLTVSDNRNAELKRQNDELLQKNESLNALLGEFKAITEEKVQFIQKETNDLIHAANFDREKIKSLHVEILKWESSIANDDTRLRDSRNKLRNYEAIIDKLQASENLLENHFTASAVGKNIEILQGIENKPPSEAVKKKVRHLIDLLKGYAQAHCKAYINLLDVSILGTPERKREFLDSTIKEVQEYPFLVEQLEARKRDLNLANSLKKLSDCK